MYDYEQNLEQTGPVVKAQRLTEPSSTKAVVEGG